MFSVGFVMANWEEIGQDSPETLEIFFVNLQLNSFAIKIDSKKEIFSKTVPTRCF